MAVTQVTPIVAKAWNVPGETIMHCTCMLTVTHTLSDLQRAHHGQEPRASVPAEKALVGKAAAIYAEAPSAIALQLIPGLLTAVLAAS